VDPDADLLGERNVGRPRTGNRHGKHQFAAKIAATRKLPTHPKYFNNGMVTVSAPIGRLQFAAAGIAEIA
jgi:hypothetical protein